MYQPKEKDDDDRRAVSRVTRTVSVELTHEEERDLGRKAAELNRQISEVEVEFAAMKESFRLKLSLKEEERDRLLALLDAGREEREVEVEEWHDYANGSVEWIYRGQLVGKRPMSNAERQMSLT